MIQQKHFDKSTISFSTRKKKMQPNFVRGTNYCHDCIVQLLSWRRIHDLLLQLLSSLSKKTLCFSWQAKKKQKRINHMIKNILQKTWNIVGIRILLSGRDLHAYNASSPNHENCYLKTPFISFPYLHPITQEHYRKSKYSNCPGHTYNSEIKKSKMSRTFLWKIIKWAFKEKPKSNI